MSNLFPVTLVTHIRLWALNLFTRHNLRFIYKFFYLPITHMWSDIFKNSFDNSFIVRYSSSVPEIGWETKLFSPYVYFDVSNIHYD